MQFGITGYGYYASGATQENDLSINEKNNLIQAIKQIATAGPFFKHPKGQQLLFLIDSFLKYSKSIKALVSNKEIAALIQSILSIGDELEQMRGNPNRLLKLIERFLESGGCPLYSFSNVRLGMDTFFNQLTVFELLHFLSNPPAGCVLLMNEYYEEEYNPPSINKDCAASIRKCMKAINRMLAHHSLQDEDFLPLIRCLVEFNLEISNDNDHGALSEDFGEEYLNLMNYFVGRKVKPNLLFSKIDIGRNIYTDVTCFQLTYLIWKHPKTIWSDEIEQRFNEIFNALLSDPRTDLMHRFSEYELTAHHFVNCSNAEYYRRTYSGDAKVPFFYREKKRDLEWINRDVDQYEGHTLERITIAHYAVTVNDYEMLTAFLEREPRLLTLTCCMTRGKGALDRTTRDNYRIVLSSEKMIADTAFESDDYLSGTLAVFKQSYFKHSQFQGRIHRITNISLLHLAARAGHETILACLIPQHPNPAAVDSENHIPQHYLQLSIVERLIEKGRQSQKMLKALEPVTRLRTIHALPQVNQIIHYEGYELYYDTSRKVAHYAHEYLTKDSFGNATRKNHRWIDNFNIPELNRASDNDYRNSGLDRGHLVPAEDATRSEKTMSDTFHPENAVPQNRNMNRGAWSCLESYVRDLAKVNDGVDVFTGPLFLPDKSQSIVTHLMGRGDVHIPTHLFKIIFKHNRNTTTEVYILPNETLFHGTTFREFKKKHSKEAIDYIQKNSGILFNQWMPKYSNIEM